MRRLSASLVLSAVLLFACSHLAAQASQDVEKAAQMDAAGEDLSHGSSRAASAFHHFTSDSVGPYPIFLALATAGIHQATNNPPDWHQGFPALSERFGSNMGITATGNAVRYGLAYATDIDLNFEKCHCTGVVPRIGHAFRSAAVARRRDGSSVLSFPNLIAPYAATTVAVYAWYPARYDIGTLCGWATTTCSTPWQPTSRSNSFQQGWSAFSITSTLPVRGCPARLTHSDFGQSPGTLGATVNAADARCNLTGTKLQL